MRKASLLPVQTYYFKQLSALISVYILKSCFCRPGLPASWASPARQMCRSIQRCQSPEESCRLIWTLVKLRILLCYKLQFVIMQGEDQKKLDILANEVFINVLRRSGQTAVLVPDLSLLPVDKLCQCHPTNFRLAASQNIVHDACHSIIKSRTSNTSVPLLQIP